MHLSQLFFRQPSASTFASTPIATMSRIAFKFYIEAHQLVSAQYPRGNIGESGSDTRSVIGVKRRWKLSQSLECNSYC
jgi:hypothetical protein